MNRQRGLSLVELLVAISVLSILIAVGTPSFRRFMINGEIRAAARSLLSGLALARTEAIRLNSEVRFVLDGNSWTIRQADNDVVLQRGESREASARLFVATLPVNSVAVTFNAAGRALRPDPDGTNGLQQLDIRLDDNGASSDYRALRVQVLPTGAARLCDPALPSGQTMACL
ncbi:MAG: hypothetical protein RL026_2300 [Pseudomonadota bacterium]|jgi:type IV fimbrial biogenesis protein FimT